MKLESRGRWGFGASSVSARAGDAVEAEASF